MAPTVKCAGKRRFAGLADRSNGNTIKIKIAGQRDVCPLHVIAAVNTLGKVFPFGGVGDHIRVVFRAAAGSERVRRCNIVMNKCCRDVVRTIDTKCAIIFKTVVVHFNGANDVFFIRNCMNRQKST